MPLKQLILNGFKSFADKTTINYDAGITGIVGPNGSGKSNITEAIRWVMGESSAKSLRGAKMKDIIFAGSQSRTPLNKAEVSLVFDNKDRKLNFNTDQVTITRTILRSGENEYYINNQSVRLKDIRNLFMDVGLSHDSLAIISQGRVDQILNSQPQERRSIFEQAAGVLHFKQQKETALKQLDQTNNNLIRINDLVKELEARVEPLHEQSSLAKEYKFTKEKLDADLKQLLALEIETLNKQKAQVELKSKKNQELLAKLDKEVIESKENLAQYRDEYTSWHDKKDQQQKDLLTLTQDIASLNTDLQMKEQSSQYNAATKKEYESQKAELIKQRDNLNKLLAEYENDISKKKDQLDNLDQEKQTLANNLAQDPDQLKKRLEQLRAEYIDVLQAQTSANNQLVYLNSELTRLQHSSKSSSSIDTELEQAEYKLTELKEKGSNLVAQRKKLEDKLAAQADKVNLQRHNEQELLQSIRQVEGQISQDQAQLNGLKRLQERHEGYYGGVKYVLNHQQNFNGIIGVIGELISFPSELEAALTTALGAGVQNIVTQTREDARDAIGQLKQNHAGRATFLPLDGVRQNSIASSTLNTLKTIEGFVGVAAELVTSTTNKDISRAINYLLGNVLVAKDMNTALRIQRRTGHYYRIVTLEGDIISPGGSMTGGARTRRNNSPLQTNTEITKLTQNINLLTKKLKESQQKLHDIQVSLKQEEAEWQSLQDNVQELKQQINEQAIRYQAQEKELSRVKKVKQIQDAEEVARAGELEELKQKLQSEKEQQTKLDQKADEYQQKMDQIKHTLADLDQAYAQFQTQLSELSSKIAVVKTQASNLEKQKDQVKHNLENNQQQIDDLNTKINSLSESNKTEKSPDEINAQIQQLTQQKEELSTKLVEANEFLGRQEAKINQLELLANRNYDLRKDAAQEQEQVSVQISKLSGQIDQKLAQLRENYSLTYEAARALCQNDNTPEIREQLQRDVKLNKMSLDDIGPVNLNAIEEYEDVKTRYDFLHGQQDDLLTARQDIEQSMAALDENVKERFKATFEQVEAKFEKIFPLMFGGGKAQLVLTDPDNLLETGVDIIAQPPGKKLQDLGLLSGGERALTAITLLFAILEVNPVPFCILDEVEAALDEANVTRFAKFLSRYESDTQFIVITHRRGTMEQADQLYGVVMQESGVSQVLSVSLKEIKDEVK
ncbi:chromosome segregation protein SMC [Lactobacillus sp. PV034]|uniref:chromosome segregation protein SMC n=1 Tax=Lactobacillus sp. PV034 TaxID=2594495 RepID=UPI0022405F39|nr:chromosome segregation protein SMC [Lactobacillus sp. PV034]QNQ80288.1 chromosome segregation protein SMC [Lactobacillus sp. PV034]